MNNAIEQSYRIKSDKDIVFRALTDPGELVKWWTTKAESDPQTGGAFKYEWNFQDESKNGLQLGQYSEVVAGEKISYPWDGGIAKTQVEFTMASEGDETVLQLMHSGWGEGEQAEEVRGMISQAWEGFLGNLKLFLESGEDMRASAMGQITQ